jgi:hypothetical protein
LVPSQPRFHFLLPESPPSEPNLKIFQHHMNGAHVQSGVTDNGYYIRRIKTNEWLFSASCQYCAGLTGTQAAESYNTRLFSSSSRFTILWGLPLARVINTPVSFSGDRG